MVKELAKTLETPKDRAPFGQWPTYAWLVRGLVEQGFGVSDAVNHVLANSGLPHTRKSFGSLRASYYGIKDKEWPAEMSNKAARKVKPEPEDETFE